MAYVEIWVSDKLKLSSSDQRALTVFLQALQCRAEQGHARYGNPSKDRKYLTRMSKELAAYKRNGNAEHLNNVAVYCWLEMLAPENVKFHSDAYAKSATRGRDGL